MRGAPRRSACLAGALRFADRSAARRTRRDTRRRGSRSIAPSRSRRPCRGRARAAARRCARFSCGSILIMRPFLQVTLPLAALNVINQASRTIMAVIGPVLAVEFAFSASELGFLAACMFIAYGAVQLPSGLALDLLGPRRVQATLSLVAAAGFAVFALSDG